jgi:hypothetical protein
MLQHIQQVSTFDVKDYLFKRHSSFLLEALVLLAVPGEVLHAARLSHCVPFVNRWRPEKVRDATTPNHELSRPLRPGRLQ